MKRLILIFGTIIAGLCLNAQNFSNGISPNNCFSKSTDIHNNLPEYQIQSWYPVGAEWTYQDYSPSASNPSEVHGITFIKCIKDTVVDGNIASVILGTTTCSSTGTIFYYNPEDDILYVRIEEDFKPYFNFNKRAGESYFMYFPNIGYSPNILPYDSLEVQIKSITDEYINDKVLRVQHIEARSYYYFFRGPIIEYIGGLDGFYPESQTCDMTLFAGLHCYSDERFSYFRNPIFQTEGCAHILNVHPYKQPNSFSVYPNPATECITLESDVHFTRVEIYDILGKCVLSKEYSKNSSVILNTQILQSGSYFIKIMLITGDIVIRKLIKL